MQYDLESRTKKLSEDTISLLMRIVNTNINKNIISQLIKSITSVGANYREANAASSKKDFQNKIFICRKEIQESKYWIELLAKTDPQWRNGLKTLWKESHELTLIFNKITSTLRKHDIGK